MPDSKFFGVPFGTSGDKATIPEATQPSGAISYQQGFGPDYERDPGADPLAKRVPRDETNELYFQTTNAIKFLQLYGLPEWYDVDDTGADVSYPITARVRHAGKAWVSIVMTNTAEPGTDPTKWAEDVAFNLPDLEASLAEALAGIVGTKIITPRRLASAVQAGAWNFALMSGTTSAATVTLSPAPAAYVDGMTFAVIANSTLASGASVNVNGLGAIPISRNAGDQLQAGDILAGDLVLFVLRSGVARIVSLTRRQAASAALLPQTTVKFTTPGSSGWTVPAGVTSIFVRMWGGGGGGGAFTGGGAGNGEGAPSGATGGAYAERRFAVTPGQAIGVAVGAGGLGTSFPLGRAGSPGTQSAVTVGAVTMIAGGGPAGLNVTTGGVYANAPGPSVASDADFSLAGERGNIGTAPGLGAFASGGYGGSSPLGGERVPGGLGASFDGLVPGGGGGSSADRNFAGGNGGRGEVHISYLAA